jgi:hypothetical protein
VKGVLFRNMRHDHDHDVHDDDHAPTPTTTNGTLVQQPRPEQRHKCEQKAVQKGEHTTVQKAST